MSRRDSSEITDVTPQMALVLESSDGLPNGQNEGCRMDATSQVRNKFKSDFFLSLMTTKCLRFSLVVGSANSKTSVCILWYFLHPRRQAHFP